MLTYQTARLHLVICLAIAILGLVARPAAAQRIDRCAGDTTQLPPLTVAVTQRYFCGRETLTDRFIGWLKSLLPASLTTANDVKRGVVRPIVAVLVGVSHFKNSELDRPSIDYDIAELYQFLTEKEFAREIIVLKN